MLSSSAISEFDRRPGYQHQDVEFASGEFADGMGIRWLGRPAVGGENP